MNRRIPSKKSTALARLLLAHEAGADNAAKAPPVVLRTIEKMRYPLARLAGVAGFCAVLKRALTLASALSPALGAVQVKSDGSLEGLSEVSGQAAGTLLIAQLIDLLVTFIGEYLTLRVLQELWLDLHLVDANTGEETKLT